uniref:Putative secreted protein n=1 Tax=Anopheles darlingi TaxID=43151 RepID=A0A2M4DFE5_ANODA
MLLLLLLVLVLSTSDVTEFVLTRKTPGEPRNRTNGPTLAWWCLILVLKCCFADCEVGFSQQKSDVSYRRRTWLLIHPR